jgi:hypothetical protein
VRPLNVRNVGQQQLPGILVGGQYPGVCFPSNHAATKLNDAICNSLLRICEFLVSCKTLSNFMERVSEDAVEYDELDVFLRLKESYIVDEDRPTPPVQPVGVPGAASPLQMTPDHLKHKMFAQSSSPLKGKGSGIPANKRENEFDVSTELVGFGLQGVKVTDDDLKALVEELGLGGDEAGDLVKGLSSSVQTVDAVDAADHSIAKSDAPQEKTLETEQATDIN